MRNCRSVKAACLKPPAFENGPYFPIDKTHRGDYSVAYISEITFPYSGIPIYGLHFFLNRKPLTITTEPDHHKGENIWKTTRLN